MIPTFDDINTTISVFRPDISVEEREHYAETMTRVFQMQEDDDLTAVYEHRFAATYPDGRVEMHTIPEMIEIAKSFCSVTEGQTTPLIRGENGYPPFYSPTGDHQ